MKIYPYEPPRQMAPNVWQIRGSLSIPVPRNMTIYRAPDGRLVLYSVIAMHKDGMRALEALGAPAIMVIPHDRHHMDVPFYKAHYPSLRVLAPYTGEVRGVAIDGGLEELALGIKAYTIPGTNYHDVVMELPGGVLCATELIANNTTTRLFKLLMRLVGPPGGGFGVSRVVKWREVTDKAAVRAWLLQCAARSDIRAILTGHTDPVLSHCHAALARAATHV